MPQLQPNNSDVAMDVLIHISQQLSNSTTPAFVPTASQVSPNTAVVNTLFFLSLTLVLIDAFLAMLVKGWLQGFDRGWRNHTVAHRRATEREQRLRELERWGLDEIVALLPILTQGSLMMFSIGLIMLLFPLHPPSAILCSIAFVFVVVFYGVTLYVPIFNKYAPFSSPVSRLLARGLTTLPTWYPRPDDPGAGASTTESLPSINGVAKPMASHKRVVPRSYSEIDPQAHVHVLERLVSTTAQTVENIPVFLGLLDQPVKDPTLQPSNMRKWRELLHITFGLLGDKLVFPVSTAWTLARTMTICFNRENVDWNMGLRLQRNLGSWEIDNQRPRMPLNALFSSYFRSWLDDSYQHDLWRTIAFLEPSDAADAELFWMVNTFHRATQRELQVHNYLPFLVAVLTYVSSTEQSRRSEVPLTAAVIYAMHTIRSVPDQGGITSIEGVRILPGTVSTPEFVSNTFFAVAGVDALDLWSEVCIQFVKDLLQWNMESSLNGDFQLSLIAALYIDSTKQAHARPIFADLLQYTRVTHIQLQNTDAYDHGKLAGYWYMALSQKSLDRGRGPIVSLYDVIEHAITEYSTLQLPGLRILEMAVGRVHKTTPRSLDWLQRVPSGLMVIAPDKQYSHPLVDVDHWVLLHLDTLLAPERYLFPEEARELEWSDTPAKVHIATVRLTFYDSLENAEHDRPSQRTPDPDLLRVFLRSKDIGVCTQAFKWCIELAPISQSGLPGDGDSIVFIPETMGPEWVEHFVHVLCNVGGEDGVRSWLFLKSHLVPKWTILPTSWCRDFASAFLFSIIHPLDGNELPAYQVIDESIRLIATDERQEYLIFLATMLELIKSGLSWDSVMSLENWLARLPEILENHNAHTQLEHILATRRQQLTEETLGLFRELPWADKWVDDRQ